MSYALADLVKDHGIEREDEYFYLDVYGQFLHKCLFNRTKSDMNVKGNHILQPLEEVLHKIVAQFGPVAVGIDATTICCNNWLLKH